MPQYDAILGLTLDAFSIAWGGAIYLFNLYINIYIYIYLYIYIYIYSVYI